VDDMIYDSWGFGDAYVMTECFTSVLDTCSMQ
jgi:hypothetical protein